MDSVVFGSVQVRDLGDDWTARAHLLAQVWWLEGSQTYHTGPLPKPLIGSKLLRNGTVNTALYSGCERRCTVGACR